MDAEEDPGTSGTPTIWSQVPAADRREVLRLARLGERHPSPEVANAVEAWAHREALDKWWNRAPGWLLPLLGAIFVATGVASDLIVLVLGGALVIMFGLLGWNTKRCGALLRRIYSR